MMTAKEVEERVENIICDALGLDKSEIEPSSTLMGDLGADSIDFLGISYDLQKEFKIKILSRELFPQDFTDDPQYVDSETGKLTSEGLLMVSNKIPFFDLGRFEDNTEVNVADLFTVNMLIKYICSELGVQT